MNKKLLLIVLGIIVLGIWIKVFSKVFDQFSDDDFAVAETPFANVVDLSKYIKRDSLPELNLNYRDPFLGKSEYKNITSNSVSQNNEVRNYNRVKETRNEEKPTEWPQIKYHGFVKVTGTNSGTLLLKINRNLLKVREGEVLNNGLSVKKAYRDSIVITNNDQVKTFYK